MVECDSLVIGALSVLPEIGWFWVISGLEMGYQQGDTY